MTGITNQQAMAALQDICRLWVKETDLKAITLTIPFANFKIEALKIDFATESWQLSSGHKGKGIIPLAAHLFDLSEVEAGRKIALMLSKGQKCK